MKRRYVGGRNVMVAGLMLSQKRLNVARCGSKRSGAFEILESLKNYALSLPQRNRRKFEELVQECRASEVADATIRANHVPFGVDPMFLPTAAMFQARLSPLAVVDHYPNLTLTPPVPPGGSSTSPEQIRLVNNVGIPFGFIPVSSLLPAAYIDEEKDFSIFFDVNLDKAGATKILDYIEQGFFFDRQTRAVILDGLYYNPDLLTFTYLKITITIDLSGFYRLERKVTPFRIDNFRSSWDLLRVLLVAVINSMLVVNVLFELRQMYKHGWRYWHHLSNLFDWCHFAVQASCWLLWINLQGMYQRFNPRSRYYVYRTLDPEANYLGLNVSDDASLLTKADGISAGDDAEIRPAQYTNLAAINHMLMSASTISSELSAYHFAQMASVVMFLIRLLQAMNFQPRLGLVTRTIADTATDIMHWMLLFAMVWAAFVVAGHLSFGSTVYEFSTIELAMLSVLKMTLGELDMLAQFVLFIPKDKMFVAQL
eukprot:g1686.t1